MSQIKGTCELFQFYYTVIFLFKFGKKYIKVWSCITAKGTGKLAFIEKNVNKWNKLKVFIIK